MDDLISRQAAIREYQEVCKGMKCGECPLLIKVNTEKGSHLITDCKLEAFLHDLPSVQPERKTAKWNFIGYNMFECTCCGTAYTTQQLNGLRNYNTDPYAPKFCPNCGADMREDGATNADVKS